jgi:uncharacterized phiE125 gp8 family phage protein
MSDPILIVDGEATSATLPVSLQYLLNHSRVDAGLDDDDVEAKLKAATRVIERATGRLRLIQSTWEYSLRGFPCNGCIEFPIPQVSSISWIKYVDSSGTTQTVDASTYHLVGGYSPDVLPAQVTFEARAVLRYSRVWPQAALETGEPVTIRFVAGWSATDSNNVSIDVVPEDLKVAIVLHAQHLRRNREAVTTGRTDVMSAPLARGVDHHIAGYSIARF